MSDVHPIRDNPSDKTLAQRVHHLEVALAILWDQVWWMNLAARERAGYEAQGFKAPIQRFYRPLDEVSCADYKMVSDSDHQ
jgi:hypothetical protein